MKPLEIFPSCQGLVKDIIGQCCSKVIMSGSISNVIMSGCGDDNPDDERRKAARSYTKSVPRRADGGQGAAVMEALELRLVELI